MLRVRYGRSYYVADCATVEEVARLVDLATLLPEQRQGRRTGKAYPESQRQRTHDRDQPIYQRLE
jgi:hypothetical protein